MYIAIITARGGSKRIPRKNVRPFCGKPIIAWSIEAAKKSRVFEHVIVSTDDKEIADVSLQYGAEVPFMRPAALADDVTHAHVAARDALERALKQWGNGNIPAFCHIYPTAPMLSSETIRAGLDRIKTGATNAFAVTRLNFPLYQALIQQQDGSILPVFPNDKFMMRSQDMPEAFFDVGQMYWFNTEHFLKHETAIGSGTQLVVVPRETALDIDTEEDWVFAERAARLYAGL